MSSIKTDEEARAIGHIIKILENRTFDAKWRMLNYVLIRMLGRSWRLSPPAGDTK